MTVSHQLHLKHGLTFIHFLEVIDWGEIFRLVYSITTEPYLQTFQYKILNRTLNCKHNMFNWKLTETPLCTDCNSEAVDTLEHHLFLCSQSNQLWKQLETWIWINLELRFNFKICEILFGIIPTTNADLCIINYLILLGKWYINNKKNKNKKLLFSEFLLVVKNKLSLIHGLHNVKGKLNTFWKKIGKVLYNVL